MAMISGAILVGIIHQSDITNEKRLRQGGMAFADDKDRA
jgi:hypothetical protein